MPPSEPCNRRTDRSVSISLLSCRNREFLTEAAAQDEARLRSLTRLSLSPPPHFPPTLWKKEWLLKSRRFVFLRGVISFADDSGAHCGALEDSGEQIWLSARVRSQPPIQLSIHCNFLLSMPFTPPPPPPPKKSAPRGPCYFTPETQLCRTTDVKRPVTGQCHHLSSICLETKEKTSENTIRVNKSARGSGYCCRRHTQGAAMFWKGLQKAASRGSFAGCKRMLCWVWGQKLTTKNWINPSNHQLSYSLIAH